jgi:phage replication O-like protein O
MVKREGIQLENGFTKIANELLDGLVLSDLTSQEIKIVLAILRRTYGWGKKEDEISVSQFELLTKLDRRNIVKTVRALAERGAITRVCGKKMKYGQPVYKYGISKNYYCQINNRTIGKSTIEPIGKSTTTKERNKILNKGRAKLVDNFTINRLKYVKTK